MDWDIFIQQNTYAGCFNNILLNDLRSSVAET